MSYVGFWRRALAIAIDDLVWIVGLFIVLSFVPADADGELLISEEAAAAIAFVFATAWFNYFSLAEARWGQTIGKNATGIEVIAAEGGRVTFAQASLRNLLRIVDLFAVGPVLMRGSARKQRLGDMAAKTVVVRRAAKAGAAPARAPEAPAPAPAAPAGPAGNEGSPPARERPSFAWVSWTPRDVLVGVIAAALLSSLGALALVAPWDPELDSAAAQLVAQLVLWATLIGVALGAATGWRFRGAREAWPRLGFRGLTWKQVGLAALTVLVYLISAAILAAVLDAVFGYSPDQEELSETLDVELTPAVVAALYVSTCVIAPLTEETFFRGFLFGGLRARWPFWAAAVLSAIVFGFVHAGTGVGAIPFLAILGAAFAWLYERTGSIWPPVVAHALNNLLAITFQVTDAGALAALSP